MEQFRFNMDLDILSWNLDSEFQLGQIWDQNLQCWAPDKI